MNPHRCSTRWECLRSLLIAGSVTGALLLSGCASSKYQTVPGGSKLSSQLALSAVKTPVAATIDTVIIRGGPGSWKNEAWWDEYVITVTNQGTSPLTVDAATLVALTGSVAVPGTDPWKLEAESKSLWARVRTSEGTTSSALITTGAVAAEMANFFVGMVAFGNSPLPSGCAMGIATAANSSIAATDTRNARSIAAEFGRRRMKLPLWISPGCTATGSLFFPVTPGPKALELNCTVGTKPHEVIVDLKPINGLHLNTPSAADPDPIGVPLAPLSLASHVP